MDQPSPLIQLQGISFAYDNGPPVLDSLDFAFSPSERAGLVGPNGSGKTTLFHLIMGLVAPTAGRLIIMGQGATQGSGFPRGPGGRGFCLSGCR